MKRRYANFHRARKWHRKFRNALYSGYVNLTDHYSKLYHKYEALCDIPTAVVGASGDTANLVALPDA